jgi:hypothetical protein
VYVHGFRLIEKDRKRRCNALRGDFFSSPRSVGKKADRASRDTEKDADMKKNTVEGADSLSLSPSLSLPLSLSLSLSLSFGAKHGNQK